MSSTIRAQILQQVLNLMIAKPKHIKFKLVTCGVVDVFDTPKVDFDNIW